MGEGPSYSTALRNAGWISADSPKSFMCVSANPRPAGVSADSLVADYAYGFNYAGWLDGHVSAASRNERQQKIYNRSFSVAF